MACLTTLYSLRRPAWSRSTGREGEATVTRAEEGDKKKRKRKEQKERTKNTHRAARKMLLVPGVVFWKVEYRRERMGE